MDKEQSELATLVSLLQNAIGESSFLRELAHVWTEIGIDEDQRQMRRELMLVHITTLLKDMTTEELKLKNKLEASLQTNIRDLSELYGQLSLTVESVPDEMSLYEKESLVRSRVDALNKVKFDRQKRMKRLIEMESAMCKSVGEAAELKNKYKADCVPSEDELKKFRKRVEDIEFILNERRSIYHDLCSKVQRIWEDLEEEPHGYFATVCKKGDKSTPVLTKDEMTKMEKSYRQIVTEAAHLEDKAQDLRQKVASLWTRLDISQDEQSSFNELNQGHKPRVIIALEKELSRLIEMKQANMKRLIHNTRVELHKVWDKCLYGEKQRQEFVPAFTDSYTDDILGDLESELDRVSGFYRDNVSIFEKVAKRELIWTKFMEYVDKDNDPSRLFNARGGQLLKDQQMKKQLQKDLVKVERGLKLELKQWEEDCERYFIIHDSRYLDTIQTQWEETDKQKQREKMKRQKDKEEITMMEMTYGSKPTTPIKKIMKRPAASPLTLPAKMRKVVQSPCVRSTLCSSAVACRPPRATRSTRNAKTPVRTPQKRLQESRARRVLKERNTRESSTDTGTSTSESFFSQANASLASTGTYTDFRCGLDANKNPRSSVIPKTSSISQLS